MEINSEVHTTENTPIVAPPEQIEKGNYENVNKHFNKKVCLWIPKFLLNKDNWQPWLPNSNLDQDSAMLLHTIVAKLNEVVDDS